MIVVTLTINNVKKFSINIVLAGTFEPHLNKLVFTSELTCSP